MKLLMISVTTLTLMSCSLFPGDEDIAAKDVPSVVKNSFGQAFPDAVDVEWEKYKKDSFEVDFEVENTEYAALFGANGNLLMQKQEIPAESLPEAIQNALQQNFADYEIDDVEKVEKEGISFYQLELDGKILDKKEIFTEDGNTSEELNFWD